MEKAAMDIKKCRDCGAEIKFPYSREWLLLMEDRRHINMSDGPEPKAESILRAIELKFSKIFNSWTGIAISLFGGLAVIAAPV